MRFRFCGDLDCPDWVLAEINTLSKMVSPPAAEVAYFSQSDRCMPLQSAIRVKVLVSQVILYCLEGELNYEKVRNISVACSELI